jgi:membrane protease YdiL (CAAX protease family)
LTNTRKIKFEIAIVLLLSLGASAIYSIVSLLEKILSPAGIGGSTSSINPTESYQELFDFAYRLIGIGLGFAPVFLVLYLLTDQFKNPFELLGLWRLKKTDFSKGLSLFALIGIPGLALYLGARALGLAAKIIPGEFEYWWLIPMLLFSALKAAAVEEVIMIGYLFKKLEQLNVSFRNRQIISATIRASYHAYQGFAGIIGNFVMGLVFGWAYRRWGRVAPLLFAHFLLDAVSFVGYALLAKQLAVFGGLF